MTVYWTWNQGLILDQNSWDSRRFYFVFLLKKWFSNLPAAGLGAAWYTGSGALYTGSGAWPNSGPEIRALF